MIVSLCFYLSGKHARAITQRVFETGIRYLDGDQGLYEDFKPIDDFSPQPKLCLVRNYALSKERSVFEFINVNSVHMVGFQSTVGRISS